MASRRPPAGSARQPGPQPTRQPTRSERPRGPRGPRTIHPHTAPGGCTTSTGRWNTGPPTRRTRPRALTGRRRGSGTRAGPRRQQHRSRKLSHPRDPPGRGAAGAAHPARRRTRARPAQAGLSVQRPTGRRRSRPQPDRTRRYPHDQRRPTGQCHARAPTHGQTCWTQIRAADHIPARSHRGPGSVTTTSSTAVRPRGYSPLANVHDVFRPLPEQMSRQWHRQSDARIPTALTPGAPSVSEQRGMRQVAAFGGSRYFTHNGRARAGAAGAADSARVECRRDPSRIVVL